MGSEHVEIWQQTPPAPLQKLDDMVDHPKPVHNQEKVCSDDMMLLGMMVWMEQGVMLDWLKPQQQEDENEESKPSANRK